MPAPKENWVSSSRNEEKPWGSVCVWHTSGNILGKIIRISEGKRTSLKYHKVKNEVFFVLSGTVRVTYGNSKTVMKPEKYPYSVRILKKGEVLNVSSDCPYRLEALEDSVIVEIADRQDEHPVRLEDDYGRTSKE